MITVSRRRFIQTSLIGAAALGLAGGLYRATHGTPLQRYRLDTAAKAALAAIVPAMLQDVPLLESDGATLASAIDRVQIAIDGLPLRSQKEIADLFGLLTLAPTRRLLAGVTNDWPDASTEQVTAFLQSWRAHRFTLLQGAYQALHDLIIGAWYGDQSTWAAIGYPGPHVRFS